MSTLVVYWIEPEDKTPRYEEFLEEPNQLTKLLNRCADLRANGKLFVTSASHDSSAGGIVKDGKLPNGQQYTWKKRRL